MKFLHSEHVIWDYSNIWHLRGQVCADRHISMHGGKCTPLRQQVSKRPGPLNHSWMLQLPPTSRCTPSTSLVVLRNSKKAHWESLVTALLTPNLTGPDTPHILWRGCRLPSAACTIRKSTVPPRAIGARNCCTFKYFALAMRSLIAACRTSIASFACTCQSCSRCWD